MKKSIDINLAIKLYRDQRLPSTKVSKMVGCSIATLIARLRDYGVEIRSCGNHQEKCDLATMKHEYEVLEMSTGEIAVKHSMDPSSVWERLEKGGIQLRDREIEMLKKTTKISPSKHSAICQKYLDNPTCSSSDIAKDYGVHKTTITAILKKHGIQPESHGSRAGNWQGGITSLHARLRNCEKASFWKQACLERDDYKCAISGGTDKIQVHHYPVSFSRILRDFLKIHLKLDPVQNCDRLFDLAQSHDLFWNIDNGITVCDLEHKKLHAKHKIDTTEIILLYEQGWSCEKISKYFGKSDGFARARLMSIGYKLRDNSFYNQQCNSVSPEVEKEILKAYLKGETTRRICEYFGIPNSRLYKILADNNVTPGTRKLVDRRSDASQDRDRLLKLYQAGATIQELAKIYDVSDTTIRNVLDQ